MLWNNDQSSRSVWSTNLRNSLSGQRLVGVVPGASGELTVVFDAAVVVDVGGLENVLYQAIRML